MQDRNMGRERKGVVRKGSGRRRIVWWYKPARGYIGTRPHIVPTLYVNRDLSYLCLKHN